MIIGGPLSISIEKEEALQSRGRQEDGIKKGVLLMMLRPKDPLRSRGTV
jgi:hypothetical protein